MEWWEFFLVLMVVMPIVVLWIGCIIDAIMRPDISGWSRLFWALAIIFFPLFGSLIYILLRPRTVMVTEPGLMDTAWQSQPRGMFDVGTRVNTFDTTGNPADRPSQGN